MRPYARFEVPERGAVELGHGDLIGRLWSARLRFDDARISEAHALVSQRGDTLFLLALRGRFAVDGAARTEVELTPGVEIQLARGLSVRVSHVELPDEVLAVDGPELGRRVLRGTTSVQAGPPVRLRPGMEPDADLWLWCDGPTWRMQPPDGPSVPLLPGMALPVGGLRAVGVSLRDAASNPTTLRGAVEAPMEIVARHDTVHLRRAGEEPVVIDGVPARVLSELALLGRPVSWELIAGEIWRDTQDRTLLRRRWDMATSRLRRRLESARLRPDLVRVTGTGLVELLLQPGDQVIDEA